LKNRFGAPGDFAEAYVIAHEVGHHVQRLLGISEKVQALRERSDKEQSSQLSVRLELQADFLAGVWAHYDDKWNHVLEKGDIQEALQAANAVGDDRLQKETQGYVVPDAFTHGTSEQRMHWFMKGYQSGDISQGDTFSAATL
jgi:predicted metalloprotease